LGPRSGPPRANPRAHVSPVLGVRRWLQRFELQIKLQKITKNYKKLQKITKNYKKLQKITKNYKKLQKKLQKFTNFFWKKYDKNSNKFRLKF
jgi:hypothetical protein